MKLEEFEKFLEKRDNYKETYAKLKTLEDRNIKLQVENDALKHQCRMYVSLIQKNGITQNILSNITETCMKCVHSLTEGHCMSCTNFQLDNLYLQRENKCEESQ